jgi:hypothetical protein
MALAEQPIRDFDERVLRSEVTTAIKIQGVGGGRPDSILGSDAIRHAGVLSKSTIIVVVIA